MTAEPLDIRLLGPMEIARRSEALELPPSKKARALAAYLAMTGRPHRREKLCSLLWDVADDPRAALRWCLTKLRDVFDDPDATRIAATRDSVSIEPRLVRVDALELRAASARGLSALDTPELERLATLVRGEFLEGLDLADFHEFHAWQVAARAEAHRLHTEVLRELIARNSPNPCDAIPWARTLVEIDPLDEDARITHVRILAAAGRRGEAEQQVTLATRLFADLGIDRPRRLQEAAPALLAQPVADCATRSVSADSPAFAFPPPSVPPASRALSVLPTRLVGREPELAVLDELLEATITSRHSHVLLLSGEPGIGKSRLLAELGLKANDRGALILHGAAWEAERTRPYVPWIDVLRCVPLNDAPAATRLRLAQIVPELGPCDPLDEATRDQLFDAVSATIIGASDAAPAALLVLDDVQWLDDASAELLHYVARSNRRLPLLIVLAARAGDLPDNEGVSRVLRSLRRDPGIVEIALGPLSAEETARLVGPLVSAKDRESLFSQSAGNPLFAIELARNAAASGTIASATLDQLVRDRLARLAPDSESLLRWCAILGSSFDVRSLELLVPEGGQLHELLETLERHALLVATESSSGKAAYGFAHGVVHRVVYDGISAPRRSLMHAKVARRLAASSDRDGRVAEELERHASLGGDAATAARAAVAAGRRFLRVFANREAESIARRGLSHCDGLDGRERAQRRLELMEIRIAARKPERIDEIAAEVEQAAEEALSLGCLEHARLGFHIVGYLKWETGRWADARRHLLRAELISRSSDQCERVVAMAEAARCLLLLEKDLGHAEALVREASALADEAGARSSAIPDALGMLRAHEGRFDEAESSFREAIAAARREGDGAALFTALEHMTMMSVDAGRYTEAIETASELGGIAEKLREGSERDFARAILAIARCGEGDAGQDPLLDAALEGLRNADAKHRLVWALNRAARGSMRRERWDTARAFALEASRIAAELGHGSERIAALAALSDIAQATGDPAGAARFASELATIPLETASHEARLAAGKLARPVASRPRKRR